MKPTKMPTWSYHLPQWFRFWQRKKKSFFLIYLFYFDVEGSLFKLFCSYFKSIHIYGAKSYLISLNLLFHNSPNIFFFFFFFLSHHAQTLFIYLFFFASTSLSLSNFVWLIKRTPTH